MEGKFSTKQLESGAELKIWLASFEAGWTLFQAILKELITCGNLDTQDPLVAMRLISSTEVQNAIWPCMNHALYNNIRIDKKTFENPEARCDYLEVLREVMSYNIAPFSKNKDLLSSTLPLRNTSTPK